MWGINLYPLFQYIQVARLRKSNQAARFSGVTRNVSSYSKHTLLFPLFGSNRKAFELLKGHLADFR